MPFIRGESKGPVNAGHKQIACQKSVVSAVAVTDTMLGMINGYALDQLKAEEIFVGKQLLAHNGIDRDRERFPEQILDDFANTLPGKSALYAHDRGKFLPLGLYFDAKTEEMTVEQFKALTGSDPRLPEGTTSVKALWAWYYVVKTPDVESVLKNINGGTYRHWSIGFNAASIVSIKNDPNGSVLYWEYVAPAEALEGSLVWLGAQQGATSQKSADLKSEESDSTKEIGIMKTLLLLLGTVLGKAFGDNTTEEQAVEAVKSALGAKDARITELETEVTGLKANAKIGEKYLEDQAAEYTRLKVLLGECEETEEAKTGKTGFAKSMGITFLCDEVKQLTARVDEKFPAGHQLSGTQSHEKGADVNPLIPK